MWQIDLEAANPDFHMTTTPVQTTYETIQVNDQELKYKSLVESQARHIMHLESEIERLQEELRELRNLGVKSQEPITPPNSSTTLPKGIQLPSDFRAGLESRLREKALIKKGVAK